MYDYILPHPAGTFIEVRMMPERVGNHPVLLGRVWHLYGIWVRGTKWVMKIL